MIHTGNDEAKEIAIAEMRGGKEPISLEDYARLFAEINVRITPKDQALKMERSAVLAKFGFTESQYLEFNAYWAEIVGDGKSPRFDKAKHEIFAGIVQKTSDEIYGIKR